LDAEKINKIYELSGMNFILVFVGGGLGAVLRWSLGFIPFLKSSNLWTSTLMANALAAVILGGTFRWQTQLGLMNQGPAWLLLAVGFCGGLSTFSTFSLETFKMIQAHDWATLIAYIGLNVGLSLLLLIFAYQFAAGWKG
jgi:CrcB protein